MSDPQQLTAVHSDLLGAVLQFPDRARDWHRSAHQPAAHRQGEPADVAVDLHAMNFELWHHEDAVRRPGVGDLEISCRKRGIDRLNDSRSVAIEDIDAGLLRVAPTTEAARLHTETPGTIVDRLSVLALRLMHTRRAWHHDPRVAVLEEQYEDLCVGLAELLAGMRAGAVGIKLYRQYKSAGQRSYCDLFEPQPTDEVW